MSKKRLITFGCSYPYGQTLPDCIGNDITSPGKTPSNLSYPSLIAKKLDRTNINLAVPGSSNKSISYRVQKFNFEIDDIVLLCWTHSERSCIIEHNTASIIGPWCPDKKSKTFYKYFNTNEEIEFNNKIFISWANYYLAQRVSRIVNTRPFAFLSDVNIDLSSENVNFLDKTINDYTVDYAADNSHPGVKSHQDFANYILTVLEKN